MIIGTKSPDQSVVQELTKTNYELFVTLIAPSLVPIVKSSIAQSPVAVVKSPMT